MFVASTPVVEKYCIGTQKHRSVNKYSEQDCSQHQPDSKQWGR